MSLVSQKTLYNPLTRFIAWLLVGSMKRRKQMKLTEGDREFVKDLSRKIILRAYLRNSASRPKKLSEKLKSLFIKKLYKAPVVDILEAVEKQRNTGG